MQIKVQLREIVNGYPAILRLAEIKLPVTISYWVGKTKNKFESEIKPFEEQRLKLFKEYGEAKNPEKPDEMTIKPENVEPFTTEVNKLLDIEVEFEFPVIKLEELGDIKIEPSIISQLTFLFE